MELLQVKDLKRVLNSRWINVANENNGGQILLEDRQSDMKVTVTGVIEPVLTISLQKEGHWNSYLKEGRLLITRHCDYLLVYQLRTQCHVVLVELKTSLDETRKELGKEQLRRSLPIWNYLFSVCKIECGSNRKISSTKYVLIAAKTSENLDKQPTLVKTMPTGAERYKNIRIKTLMGTNFAIETLIN